MAKTDCGKGTGRRLCVWNMSTVSGGGGGDNDNTLLNKTQSMELNSIIIGK